MLKKFHHHIKKQFPFLLKTKICVAVSGGVDSIVLVNLLHSLKMNFVIAHCNFNLRGDHAKKDEQFVCDLAKKIGVEYFVKQFDTKHYAEKMKISIQMAARNLRYEWFEKLMKAQKINYLFTAHHLDDQAETFLINFTRGSGIEGLMGIPNINQKIVRPLLPFSKDKIKNFALENKIKWREDISNFEDKYTRNNIRNNILPILKKLNTNFLQSFENTISNISGIYEIAKNNIEKIREKLFVKNDDITKINIEELQKLQPLKTYIYELFKPYGFTQINDILNSLNGENSKHFFSKTHRLIKDRKHLLLTELCNDNLVQEFLIQNKDEFINSPLKMKFEKITETKIEHQKNIAYLDFTKLSFPLILRKWHTKDKFKPFGMKGIKKVGKFLRDEKISLIEKENSWVLCNSNEILWLVNHRISDKYKVTNNTKIIYKISLIENR